MKRLKTTPVQRYKIEQALRLAGQVLQEVKQGKLEGEALKDMKTLETAVVALETVNLAISGNS